MKQTFTFSAFMVLVTLIAFGNNTVASNIERTGKSRFEKNFKGVNPNDFHSWQSLKNSKKRNASENFRLKSAQAAKQRLDSYSENYWDDSTSQWIIGFKVEFTYDANWNLTQELQYGWDETTGQLTPQWKTDYSYDAYGNMTKVISYGGWADANETIHLPVTVSLYYGTYSYDANGNKTQEIDYKWDKILNQFVADYKYNYTYDANGNMLQEIESRFDTNQLETKTKVEHKYDNKGKLLQTTSFDFSANTNDWIKGNLEEYTYDSNGNKKLVVLTRHVGFWDNADQYVTDKEEYTYDSKGNNILVYKTDYAGSSNGIAFYRYYKDEYTYDANGHLTQHLNSSTDNNGVWVVGDKSTNSYDDKGNLTQDVGYYNWDEQTNQFKDGERNDYTFDNNYAINDLIIPYYWESEFVSANTNMMTEINTYYWNNDTNSWELAYKSSLAYSPVNVTSIKPLNSGLLSVYPNPCSESVSISFPSSFSQIGFELFDLQGRLVMKKEVSNHEKVSLEGFGSGMYICKLNVDGKLQSGKLVKE
jgi:hypothetical protein